MESLRLPRALHEAILRHARSGFPQEICGLLGGSNSQACSHYPIDNIATEPETRFEMDPAQLIHAMRRMREKSETLTAIYHSHPSGPATPSATDLEEAAYPEACYLIVSLENREQPEMAAYRLEDGQFRPVELQTTR